MRKYLLPFIGITTIILIGIVYYKGQSAGENKQIVKELTAEVKSQENYEEKRQEIIKLPPSDLLKRYCEWVRDDKELCLQSNQPIP